MDDNLKFSLLTDDNYAVWVKDIEFVLRGKGCWLIVEGIKPKLDEEASRKEILDVQTRTDKALSVLYYLVTEKFHALICDEKDPVKVWAILKEHFRSVSCASIIPLLDNFLVFALSQKKLSEYFVPRFLEQFNCLKTPVIQLINYIKVFK